MATETANLIAVVSADTRSYETSMDGIVTKTKETFTKITKNGEDVAFKNKRVITEIAQDGSQRITTLYETQRAEVQRSIQDISQSLESVGKNMTAKLTVPIVGLGTLITTTASQIQEMTNRLDVVFGSASEGVKSWTETLSTGLNRSRFDLQDYVSSYNILLQATGLAKDETEGFSKQLTQLTVDLASF